MRFPWNRSPIEGPAVLLALLVILNGCADVAPYLRDRALDLTDVLDLKAGLGFGLAGVKAEASDYIGAGVGIGHTGTGPEWYGRRFYSNPGGYFFHILAVGVDEMPMDDAYDYMSRALLGYNLRYNRPPTLSRFRIGLEAFIPGVHLGIYANMGEVLDLVAGLAAFDPANDDGVPKSAKLNLADPSNMYGDIPYSIPHAIDALDSPTVSIRRKGALALGRLLPSARSVNALIRAMEDVDADVRENAAVSLGRLRSRRAVEELIIALQDPRPQVGESAAEALRSITGRDFGADVDKWTEWWEWNK